VQHKSLSIALTTNCSQRTRTSNSQVTPLWS